METTINVKVTVDLSESTKVLVENFLGSFKAPKAEAPKASATNQAAGTTVAISAPVESAAKPAAPTAKPAAPTAKPVTPVVSKAEAPKAPASSITIDMVRKALAEKVNEHRDEIRQKLNELGAPNVTKLEAVHYADMLNFLSTL